MKTTRREFLLGSTSIIGALSITSFSVNNEIVEYDKLFAKFKLHNGDRMTVRDFRLRIGRTHKWSNRFHDHVRSSNDRVVYFKYGDLINL